MSEMQSTTDNTLNEQTQQQVLEQVYAKVATQLGIKPTQVVGFVNLYDEGATVPFIARYRKEQTGGLDDSQLRDLEKLLNYERDMLARREKIINMLTAQGKLTDELKTRIEEATSKLQLEDIYLPYRPRRRSLSAKAIMAELEPIASALLQTEISPAQALADYQQPENITDDSGEVVEVDFADFDKQLAGVKAIIIDQWLQELDLLDNLRTGFAKTATLNATLANEEKREVGEKFKDYFEHSESLARLPNHRLLAMLRGRQENVLTLKVDGENQPFIDKIIQHFELTSRQPAERQDLLLDCANSLWADKWRPNIEHRLLTEKRLLAEADAIDVFANNLQHLLMSAPAGRKVILGVDPGIRHGVKMAVIGAEGQVLQSAEDTPVIATVYPFDSATKLAEAKTVIGKLISEYQVNLVAVGNGTASRETDALIKEVINENKLSAIPVMVNEAGASVYSASELASDELAELDVSIRGAVSIARRLQDPLSELVKVEPKAIGVGQYQHDVNQSQLADSLDKVTQDCVNAVGVDVNTASPAILSHISGLNRNVAQQIVNYRKENGAFSNREQLKAVPRLGVKTFEQSAGFLRIRDGEEPLDATGVHPESYELVHELLSKADKSLDDVLGNDGELQSLLQSVHLEEDKPQLAINAIVNELAKPAHDPRPEFKTAKFREDVNSISDLEEGMVLEGVVTNVTSFGCFVDVGVHQDGLVHISQMANDFVEDPLNHVTPGDIIKVRVLSVDEERKRIGFSMREATEGEKKSNKENRSDSAGFTRSENEGKKGKEARQRRPEAKRNHANRNHKGNAQKSNAKDSKNTKTVGTLGALLKQAGL